MAQIFFATKTQHNQRQQNATNVILKRD